MRRQRKQTMLSDSTQRAILSGLLLLFAFVGCSSADHAAGFSATAGQTKTSTAGGINKESIINFTLSGGNTGQYTVRAALPTSKLRHGHKEFTIDVEQSGVAVFLVFYGYEGPATYTLAQNINGGDIHIALGKNTSSWDLSLQPKAQCTMTVQSVTPIQNTNLDRMKGIFSCPLLFSSAPNHPVEPVTVSRGIFDVAIIVES